MGLVILPMRMYHDITLETLMPYNEDNIADADPKYAMLNNFHTRRDDNIIQYRAKLNIIARYAINYYARRWPQAQKYISEWNSESFPEFYTIPKMHKQANDNGTPKTRPIVGCKRDSLQYKLSKVIALELHPIICTYNTVLQNSMTIVQDLRDMRVNDNTHLFTIDFVNLYGEIPLPDLYIQLQNANIKSHIRLIAKFILENNYFRFASQTFKQLKGIAMGTNVAPDLANLYLYQKLDRLFADRIPARRLKYYKRYIDDIFGIFEGTITEFNTLINEIKRIVNPLQVTYQIHAETIDFLDISIFKTKNEEGNYQLHTKVYQKPHNTYQYVPFLSNHPASTKSGFIKGELIRYRRICSRDIDYSIIRSALWERLRNRGYPQEFLLPIFALAPVPNQRNSTNLDLSVLILDHKRNGIYKPFQTALRIMESELQEIDPEIKLLLCTRQPGNIGSLLLESSIPEDTVQHLIFEED
jgi:hypothetical protein